MTRMLRLALLLFAAALVPALLPAALPAAVDGEELPSLAPVIDKVAGAVVNISTESTIRLRRNPLFEDPFFRRFFNVPDQPLERKRQSLGSGVIIDAERGLVVTAAHVIAEADQITVKLQDGRAFEAELLGADPDTDVALVRIPAKDLQAATLADSDDLRVGDFVIAIGNPFGLEHTVTSGIVSALARSGLGIGGYEDYIQTDASINPGNSGGALVNLRGELVGINTAIFSRSGGNIGIGFAIPSNMTRRVAEQLASFGEVRRGYIGVRTQDLDPDLAAAFGVEEGTGGAVVVDVQPDSPAAEAGLRTGDVIVAVNGRAVDSAAAARNRLGLLQVGEEVELEVLRGGTRRVIQTRVASREAAEPRGPGNPLLAGATFGAIHPRHPLHGKVEGVMVYEIERGSRAWRAGLRKGDVVISVNRQPVAALQEFLDLVTDSDGPLLLQVRRGNGIAFMVIK